MDAFSSGNEYDAEPMDMDMLKDICDRSQSHPRINRGEACYRILDHVKQSQV